MISLIFRTFAVLSTAVLLSVAATGITKPFPDAVNKVFLWDSQHTIFRYAETGTYRYFEDRASTHFATYGFTAPGTTSSVTVPVSKPNEVVFFIRLPKAIKAALDYPVSVYSCAIVGDERKLVLGRLEGMYRLEKDIKKLDVQVLILEGENVLQISFDPGSSIEFAVFHGKESNQINRYPMNMFSIKR